MRRTEGSKEPPVLAADVALLEHLLCRLLGVLPCADLLESLGRDDTLERLELERVASRHQVVVVDDLDKRLDLVPSVLRLFAHAARHLGRVALNADNERVAKRMRLVALVDRLDDDDLQNFMRENV